MEYFTHTHTFGVRIYEEMNYDGFPKQEYRLQIGMDIKGPSPPHMETKASTRDVEKFFNQFPFDVPFFLSSRDPIHIPISITYPPI